MSNILYHMTKRIGLRIHVADVIADHDRGSVRWHVLDAGNPRTVEEADDDPGEESHQELGKQRVDVDRDQRIQHGDDQEQFRDR